MVHIGTVYWGQNVASVPYWTRPPNRNSTLRKAQEWVDPDERANSAQVLKKSQRREQISEMRRVERESERGTSRGQGERVMWGSIKSDKGIFCNGLEGS
jgi:hypothetical protein